MPFPALPDAHGVAVLALVVISLVLFTRESIPLETSSLAVLAVLTIGFEVFPYTRDGETLHAVDFFSGFGHEALIAVCALMMAGQGLVRTGALEPVGRALAGLWSVSPSLSLLLTLVGGMSTTIGTSTNLLVISVAADLGLKRFSMFEFIVPAAAAGGLAIVYLWLVAPRLLPPREAALGDLSPRVFDGHLHIEADGFADGKTLAEALERAGGLKVAEIMRDGSLAVTPLPDLQLRAGDRLGVRDTPQNLKEFEDLLGARLYTGDFPVDDEHPLLADDQQIAEIAVTQGSPLEGRTLSRARFADTHQLLTLALHRAGATLRVLRDCVADVRLRVGDVLLVQGTRNKIAELKRGGEFLVLDATADLPHTKKAPLALIIMIAIIAPAAFGLLPIAVSAVSGALVMIVSRCMGWRDAVRALSTPVIMIVVASLALGSALLKTGGADYLAQVFLAVSADAPAAFLLSGLMLVMAVLTNIVSNNAAAVIGTPIAVGIARELGLAPEPFVLAVLFGANMSYATPMAYKTNLLVMSAGGYKFSDFLRAGIPLTVILWLALSWLLPVLYGL